MNRLYIYIQSTANIFLVLMITVLILLFYLPGCGLHYNWDNSLIRGDNQDDEEKVMLVKEVIDGDTLILSDGEKVRLIGINTPERDRYYFGEAKDVLEVMVLGKEIKLEKDVTNRDMYGRLLRYVYVKDLFVNLEMIKRGFANTYTYPPDVKHTEEFLEAERNARLHEIGLWKKSKISSIKIDINYDAEGNDNKNLNGEYVAVKNIGTDTVDMGGWTVKDSGTNIYEFYECILKPSFGIYLFSGNGKDTDSKFYWGSTKPVWNNDHDTLYLRDTQGLLVEIYNY